MADPNSGAIYHDIDAKVAMPSVEPGETATALATAHDHVGRADAQLDRLENLLAAVLTGEDPSPSVAELRAPVETKLGAVANELAGRLDTLVDRINALCARVRI